jgi:HEXXH motif-containing protein
VPFHELSWLAFDQLARGFGGPETVRMLRRADRSRRLLLLRALVDDLDRLPNSMDPLPPVDVAWELLVRVQEHAPGVWDLMLSHPYTGTWLGYTTRLLRGQTVAEGPLWIHSGQIHALVAAAAIRAGLAFETRIPMRHGKVVLPTLGMACLREDSPYDVADVHSDGHRVNVGTPAGSVWLPSDPAMDVQNWWGLRELVAKTGDHHLVVRLDDLDPYRSLHRPAPPRRLERSEVDEWRHLLEEAWGLIVTHLPDYAKAIPAGFDSVVPRPAIPSSNLSASTGEAFGSAIIGRPTDAESLAATIVHEFQHIRLSALLHLIELHEDDSRQRFYTPWRDDPRPIGGVLQGVYAFFGVTEFWRALAGTGTDRAVFEFAYWRQATWRVLRALREDPGLNAAGQRFVDGIAERLGPWQQEPVPAQVADLTKAVSSNHYAGWRMRYVRPRPDLVEDLTDAWLAARPCPVGISLVDDRAPVSTPDGSWSSSRAFLVRMAVTGSGRAQLAQRWSVVPDATEADYAYADGRYDDAVQAYQQDLRDDPDSPVAWVGLALALSALGTEPNAARVLLFRPELVRAVHRRIRRSTSALPAPDELAGWIGSHG